MRAKLQVLIASMLLSDIKEIKFKYKGEEYTISYLKIENTFTIYDSNLKIFDVIIKK